MKTEIKEKWISALRSGDYMQGRSKLRTNDNKFCCLGVLCDLYAKENPSSLLVSSWHKVTTSYFFGDQTGTLPIGVAQWAGLGENMSLNEFKNSGIAFGKYGEEKYLTRDNDNGKSFSEIADIIQENF